MNQKPWRTQGAQGARAEQHSNPKMTTGNGWGDAGVTGGTSKE